MHITSAHIPTIVNAMSNAQQDGKEWLAFDSDIQLLSAYDLHYFESPNDAADFQLFNHLNDKEVTLLPTEALLGFVQETARENLKEGNGKHIEVDDENVLTFFSEMKFNQAVVALEELMDQHDWKNAVYEPEPKPVEGAPLSEIMPVIQQSFAVEQLARFAKYSDKAAEKVSEMAERHWKGTAMEKYIPDVVSGKLIEQKIIHEHKTTITMTQKNLEYLQDQIKKAGFSEALFPELERNMMDGKESFELKDNQTFGKDQLSSTLHFARSGQEGSDMYFFNRYDTNLKNQTINATQTFFINNKGQSIDLNEANNLLNGRSVYKEVTPKEGDKYKAWLKLDFGEKDEHGNSKMQYFNQKYGFDLKEAIGRLELKEMANPEKMEQLFASLQRGDLTNATLLKGGKEIPVQITTDPKFKTLKMYGEDGSKLFVPGAKQDARYGQAPVDAKRETEGTAMTAGEKLNGQIVTGEQGTQVKQPVVDKKKDLLPKNENKNNLLPKKRVRQGKGQGIA